MKGENIAARDVIVWLPPNYESAANEHYPVIYMHDGQNIFDPATSSFGVDWAIDETVDALIKKKAIPPVIVVGIYNTPDRLHEYTPGEKGTAYMDFVVRKLKPLIDSTYRTKPGRAQTIVGGSSAGGNISFMLLWKHPDVFSKAICMSPAFRAPDFLPVSWDLVKVVQSSNGNPRNVFIYLDNGGVGLERELQPGIDEILTVLKARGYKADSDFVFILDANAKHSEVDWAQRFPKALLLVLGNLPLKGE